MPTAQDPNTTIVQKIADNLNQAGHSVQVADVKPTTAETPIQKTEDLLQAGAKVIGEDLEYGGRDLGYMTEADLKHGERIRTTESRNPLKLLVGKLLRKKSQDEEVVKK